MIYSASRNDAARKKIQAKVTSENVVSIAKSSFEPRKLVHSCKGRKTLPEGFRQCREDKIEPMQSAPDDVRPVGAVPQAADQKGEEQVERPARLGHPVASQRDVHVVAEPGGQGDVPAPPEFRDGTGEVGMVEVFHQLHTHHLRRPKCDIGIAGEVAVDLDREGQGRQHQRRTIIVCGVAINRVHEADHTVCNDNFLEHAPCHPLQAVGHAGIIEVMFRMQLVQDVLRALDGPCHQLRVIQHIESQIPKVPLCLLMAAIHLDGVAQRLKGVKGQPDRKDDRREFGWGSSSR